MDFPLILEIPKRQKFELAILWIHVMNGSPSYSVFFTEFELSLHLVRCNLVVDTLVTNFLILL